MCRLIFTLRLGSLSHLFMYLSPLLTFFCSFADGLLMMMAQLFGMLGEGGGGSWLDMMGNIYLVEEDALM